MYTVTNEQYQIFQKMGVSLQHHGDAVELLCDLLVNCQLFSETDTNSLKKHKTQLKSIIALAHLLSSDMEATYSDYSECLFAPDEIM